MGHYRSEMCCNTCGDIPCSCPCDGCGKVHHCICPCKYCGQEIHGLEHNCPERWKAISEAYKKFKKLNKEK